MCATTWSETGGVVWRIWKKLKIEICSKSRFLFLWFFISQWFRKNHRKISHSSNRQVFGYLEMNDFRWKIIQTNDEISSYLIEFPWYRIVGYIIYICGDPHCFSDQPWLIKTSFVNLKSGKTFLFNFSWSKLMLKMLWRQANTIANSRKPWKYIGKHMLWHGRICVDVCNVCWWSFVILMESLQI